MRGFFSFFFHTLGVIFFILICGGVYLWYADPFEVRPIIKALTGNAKELSSEVVSGVEGRVNEDKHPNMNAGQERALELVGIDPGAVPTKLTPEQEACFAEVLGADRVVEIKAGAAPQAAEIIVAKDCLDVE